GIRSPLVTGVQTCALPICAVDVADNVGIRGHRTYPTGYTSIVRHAYSQRAEAGVDNGVWRPALHCGDSRDLPPPEHGLHKFVERSEERRVGKERSNRWTKQ